MPQDNLFPLPDNLPVPKDDGACRHLTGLSLPAVRLHSTSGNDVNIGELAGITVLYFYPRTGRPDKPIPQSWNEIPGARGCTPQSCAFRDHHAELQSLGAHVYGLSTQTTEYQQEVATRLHLPFELLSDVDLRLTEALNLPTFEFDGETLTKRFTLIVRDGTIVKVFYPVFPPDANAAEVVAWLSEYP